MKYEYKIINTASVSTNANTSSRTIDTSSTRTTIPKFFFDAVIEKLKN